MKYDMKSKISFFEIKLAFCSRDKQANCKCELAQNHKKILEMLASAPH